MLKHSLPSLLERAKKVLLIGLLKPITDTNLKTKQRNELRYWVWVVIWGVTVAVVIVGGRFLFFEVEGDLFRLPLQARDWTGFGESYDSNVSEVAEKGTETDGKITKKIDKITTTQKKLQPAKTLWDWMSLLLAPATLAGLGFLFQSSQEKAKRDKEEADKKRDADQQREQALQTYFEQLSALLVDKRLLRNLTVKEEESTNSESPSSDNPASKPESKIDVNDSDIDAEAALDVVKAKTLALFRLFDNADPPDTHRKVSVLAFLSDTGLLKALALDLSRSHWEKSNLENADLSSTNLSRANLFSANLASANLNNAILSRANLIGANLSSADLSSAKLNNAKLNNAILSIAKLSNADLSDADLTSAFLLFAKLSNANLIGTKLSNADLSNADLTSAFLLFAKLSNANLCEANLCTTNLSLADLSRANLIGANLSSADLSNANLSNANLSNANLSNANLSNADLSNADLTSANLTSANLDGANLNSANLSDAILVGINITTLVGINITTLVGINITKTPALTQQQLEGEKPPLLCNVKLPDGINVDPDRDCKKLPEVLLERYPDQFKTLGEAQDYVGRIRNLKE